jgi:hypothetical protein
MNINEFVKNFEDVIYGGELIEIASLSIRVKRYIPIEQKIGLANRLFNMLYSDGIFDYINGTFLMPIMILKEYCDELEFPKNIEDLDATGFYDTLCVSGAMDEINLKLGKEILEIKELVEKFVLINNTKEQMKNPLMDLLGDAMSKTPEDIEAMRKQANELMADENIKNMLEFKNRG